MRLGAAEEGQPVESLVEAVHPVRTLAKRVRSYAKRWQFVIVGIAAVVLALFATRRLAGFSFKLSWVLAWRGIKPLLPLTVPAALRVCGIWAWATAAIAGALLKIDPDLDLSDAILGGASGLWIFAYIAGQLLGPIGLFREATVWILLGGLTLWLWRYPPVVSVSAPSTGQKLALLAWALLALSMVPLQLGSPIPPYMDVLSYPSSAQRILTFHVYDPFNNNPYGLFGTHVQTPALELFYALLAMSSRTKLAALAETAAMVPMAGLIIFATYRLGKTLFNDLAGGMATLLLFFTCLFRRAQGMRGTAVDFALVAIGLAFFLDGRRNRVLMAFGVLALGTAVASHAIDGPLAMLLALIGILLWLANGDLKGFVVGAACIAGGALVASPEIAIAFAYPVAYPILPLVQLAGIILIMLAASRLGSSEPGQSIVLRAISLAIAAFLLYSALMRNRVTDFAIWTSFFDGQPFLVLLCCGGAVVLIMASLTNKPSLSLGSLSAAAVLFGVAGASLGSFLGQIGASPSALMMTQDIQNKLFEYWCPYFMAVLAGLLLALAYEHLSGSLSLLALMALLIYPWMLDQHSEDTDSLQHSIAEQWAFNLNTAANGYFVGSPDSRWTLDSAGFALVDILNREIKAGRITVDTHILHLTDTIYYWILLQYPVFTGINDDPIDYQDESRNLMIAGGRVREIGQLQTELAKNPPYILEQTAPPSWMTQPPPGYIEIFRQGKLRLFRRQDL
jgi:hypothetical protein